MTTPLATTQFIASPGSADILIPLSVRLEPGHYGLIFWAVGLNAGVMPTTNSDIPGRASYFSYVIDIYDGVWREYDNARGMRFVVTGIVIPEPATWLLAAVATAFFGVRRKRSRQVPETFAAFLLLAVAISIGLLVADPICAQSYRATLLNPTGSTYSYANGNSATSQVGLGRREPTPHDDHAFLWHGTAESVIDLHPVGFLYSEAKGIEGNSQVGSAWNFGPGDDAHAFLWQGTAESAIDLHPAGFRSSSAQGLSDTSQAGTGITDDFWSHALLWHGNAESVVDLHPAGFADSHVGGVFEDTQVGSGTPIDAAAHALLWRGTPESVVDLHPAGFTHSEGKGVSEGTQVGDGITIEGARHALLWYGTAESVVDLHPVGFDGSGVSDVSGNRQVGYARNFNLGGYTDHAMLWTGIPESAVDLHVYLEGLGVAFLSSRASGIADNGDRPASAATCLVFDPPARQNAD